MLWQQRPKKPLTDGFIHLREESPLKRECGRLPSIICCVGDLDGAPFNAGQRARGGRDPSEPHTKQAPLASYLGLVRL